jgi:tetratricopeptide (TPR) repeat protein
MAMELPGDGRDQDRTASEARKWVAPVIVGAILLFILASRLPAISESSFVNRTGIATMLVCAGTEEDPAFPAAQRGISDEARARAAWLFAREMRCKGRDDAARLAIRISLEASDARLEVMRVAAPFDLDLASLAATTYPTRADAHFWHGDAAVKAQQWELAKEAYRRGLAIKGSEASAWLALGDLHAGAGDTQAASEAYDSACRYGDPGLHGCMRAGDLYRKLGRHELAAQRYGEALRQAANRDLPYVLNLAKSLVSEGKTGEAQPYLQMLAERGSPEAQQMLKRLQQP